MPLRFATAGECEVTAPRYQCSLSTRRVILDPIDGLSGQSGLLRNVSDAQRLLSQHGAHLHELLAREARLPVKVGAFSTLLGVLDTGTLRGPRSLSRCLRGRGYEGDQRVANCLLYRVSGRAIEGEVVDHRADRDATTHELPNGVAHILVIPAEPIDPTSPALSLSNKQRPSGRSTRRLWRPDHFVDGEAHGPRVSKADARWSALPLVKEDRPVCRRQAPLVLRSQELIKVQPWSHSQIEQGEYPMKSRGSKGQKQGQDTKVRFFADIVNSQYSVYNKFM